MSKKDRQLEAILEELQRLVRRPPSASQGPPVASVALDDDLESEEVKTLSLVEDERDALGEARRRLAEDLRFEHLKERDLKAATWRFVCLAYTDREQNHVRAFLDEHALEVLSLTCFFPVEFLTVQKGVDLFGVRFSPIEVLDVPRFVFGADPDPTVKSAISVPCRGTDYGRMRERALPPAEHALRLLRATLREEQFMPDHQLRFRLGEQYWFDDGATGWTTSPDREWELELDEQLVRRVTSHELSTLPLTGANEVEHRTNLALRWFERAQLAADPNVEVLYLFFALESMIGDKSEGLKASALAVRRAVLGLAVRGGFTHPARIFLLYDEVRSAAVHGEVAPELGRKEVDRFAWDVRRAISEFLSFARTEGLTKRKQVRKALDTDERLNSVLDGLLREDPKLWQQYVDRVRKKTS